MNEIDKFYTRDVVQFSNSYFNYLTKIFKKIDLREIQSFVDTLLSAREAGSLIFFMGNNI